MAYSLNFQIRHSYDTRKAGISLPVVLQLGDKAALCEAKVDTGAQLCLFQREVGEHLGLDIESGDRMVVSSLGGPVVVYGHFVTLNVLELEFDSVVYFAQDYGLSRNLLGREGWLQKVRLAVVDYDAELYLSPYDPL